MGSARGAWPQWTERVTDMTVVCGTDPVLTGRNPPSLVSLTDTNYQAREEAHWGVNFYF